MRSVVFPASDPTSAALASLATFGIAFFARPVGSAVFGHFGDRVGRKTTLVAALLTMGISTVAIGALPTYASIGIAAPLLRALDLVEVNPILDDRNTTAVLATELALSALGQKIL